MWNAKGAFAIDFFQHTTMVLLESWRFSRPEGRAVSKGDLHSIIRYIANMASLTNKLFAGVLEIQCMEEAMPKRGPIVSHG